MIILAIEVLIGIILIMILAALFLDEKKNREHGMHAVRLKGYWDGGERRTVERFNIMLDVRYALNGKTIPTKSADISTKGIKVLMDERLECKTPIRIEIKLPQDQHFIKARGQVAWSSEAKEDEVNSAKRLFNTGIKFYTFQGNGEKRLFDFIYNPQAYSR